MPFGKHKGVLLSELDASYIKWVLGNCERLNIRLRGALETELKCRPASDKTRPPITVMPFGKHRGKQISELPVDYVSWLITSGVKMSKDLMSELYKLV